MSNLQIEQTPVDALKQQNRNSRTHSRRQIRQIADSIRQFGFNNPVLMDDNLTILAGHGRVEAAKQLEMATVPTVRLSHLNETQERAYLIADNALATKAGWDGLWRNDRERVHRLSTISIGNCGQSIARRCCALCLYGLAPRI